MNIRFGTLGLFVVFLLLAPGLLWNEVGEEGYTQSKLKLDERIGRQESDLFSQKLVKAFGTKPICLLYTSPSPRD